jgi:hypothetical protein
MLLKLLLLSCMALANAEAQVDMLAENTCGLIDFWKQNGYFDSSAKYVVDGKEEIIHLSYHCKERFGRAISNCRSYVGALHNSTTHISQMYHKLEVEMAFQNVMIHEVRRREHPEL